MPQPYRDMLMFNPIAHGLELVRAAFFPYYHAVPGISSAYLYGCRRSGPVAGHTWAGPGY
jgi:capsular polysaccharide transport system permease protein